MNGDYTWAKKLCPSTLKYWTKDSQLESVGTVDDQITSFPAKLVEVVGSIQEVNVENNNHFILFNVILQVNEPVVIFSAFGGDDGNEWNNNFELGRNLIIKLQELFTHAMDKDGRVLHEINYIDKKIEGFNVDNDLLA